MKQTSNRFLMVVLGLLAAAGTAGAATVKKVNAKKGLVAAELQDEEAAEKDQQACFQDDDGKNVDCGTVVKVKDKTITIKIKSKKKMKSIVVGMTVKIGDAAASDSASAETEEGKGKSTEGKASTSKKPPFRVWLLYNAGLSTPVQFNKLGYQAPPANSTASHETLWAADKKIKQALFGFNLQVGIPLGSRALAPGVRYRKFTPSLVDADYTEGVDNPYSSTEQQATSIGLFVDYEVTRIPIGKAGGFSFMSGLDFDSATVTVKAKKKNEQTGSEDPIGSATAKDTVLSLRLGGGLDLVFAKPFGVHVGTTLMLPLAEFSKATAAKYEDPDKRGVADPEADLAKQVGLKKNSVAFEITLGGVLSF